MKNFFEEDYFERGRELKLSPYERYDWNHVRVFALSWGEAIAKTFHPKNLLDIGCAKGFLVMVLRSIGIDAYGLDRSTYAIEKAPKVIKPYLQVQDIETSSIPFPEKYFDVVTMLEVIEHLSEEKLAMVLMRIRRVLKDGGFLIITTPNPSEKEFDVTHKTIKTKAEWIHELKKVGFERDLKSELKLLVNLVPIFSLNVQRWPAGSIYKKFRLQRLKLLGKTLVLLYSIFYEIYYYGVKHTLLVFKKRG